MKSKEVWMFELHGSCSSRSEIMFQSANCVGGNVGIKFTNSSTSKSSALILRS